MVISLYLFFCWFLCGVLFSLADKVSRQHFAFVLLMLNFINTNISYLLADPIKFYSVTKDPMGYVAFSLYQCLIIPALMTIIVGAYINQSTLRGKMAVILISVCVIAFFDWLSCIMGLFILNGSWQMTALFGYRLILLCLGFLCLKSFRRVRG
ncbi:hypothetical protein DL346_26240 [Paenibacillus montanisoli]|uniref:Uncharacterized protein n=1 Tax=Paenibacillus montanisoli TaxID=2081970 RepID=A0A328TT75_9BACL|nr:hypothetical protein DL346_26240 [Paenibacillus montanisoli]